jgi:hypothetical protein
MQLGRSAPPRTGARNLSIIGIPSFAMLLVLTNIALCLCVDREQYTSDLRRPTTLALSPAPLGGLRDVKPSYDPDDAALIAIVPLPTD